MGLLAERSPVADDGSTIYFTFHKRDTSFLSLPKRTLSKSTSWTCTSDVYDFAQTEKPMPTTRRMTSRESMRSIPSAKPAPSATLPDLPISPITSPCAPKPKPKPKQRPASIVVTSPLSATFSLRESVTSQDRRKSRMDALACLEGRTRTRSTLCNNFMSFSDDEDESKSPDDATLADVEDEADPVVSTAQHKAVRPARPNRKRRSTLESWFPLKSFIDLKDDDLTSWNWRSFIEIGGVS